MVPDNQTAPELRGELHEVERRIYALKMAIEDGDRDLALRIAAQLSSRSESLANAVKQHFFPTRVRRRVDRSQGLFPVSAPPLRS